MYVRLDLRVTATNTPKWIVTVCHQKKNEGLQVDENALRLAMCHSNKTAETFYLREDLTEFAARATMAIAQCTQDATPLTTPQGSSLTSHQSSTQSQAPIQRVTTPGDSQPTPPLGESATSFETSSQSESHLTPVIQPEDSSDMQPTRSLSERQKTVISEASPS